MSPSPQLAPPGSSTYNSDTMHVGDGTWDAGRDDFLLPNLVGLNFATMRYNGMGNRFFTMVGYHKLVEAHGIIAAITFLLVVPAAIFLMRFYGRNPRQAVRFHIWLQILALLLVTVVFIIGWFQVGPKRSLTNPHHGIGLALFILMWVQVISGAIVHRSEKRHRHLHVTLKAMLHHWLGRAIALLGIVQIALGLTLYGSPVSLFVLYTLWTFFLLVIYFFLEWQYERRKARYDTGTSEAYTEEVVQQKPSGGVGWGKLAAAGATGAGIAALWRRASGRKNRPPPSELAGTGSMASSYYYDDKVSDTGRKGFGRRLMEIGAIGGGIAAAKRIFGRREERDDDSIAGPYRPPLGGNQSVITDNYSRVDGVNENGIPPRPVTPGAGVAAAEGALAGAALGAASRPTHPLAQPPLTPGSRHSSEEYSYYDYESNSPSRRNQTHTFRDAVAAGGAMFAVRQLFKSRKQRKEEQRADQLRNERLEQERIARMNSQRRYTGDGAAPLRRSRHNRMDSQTASDVSGPILGSVHPPGHSGSTIPIVAGGAGAAAASALADRDRIRPVGTDPVISPPGPATAAMPSDLPPPPPPHMTDLQSSGSDLYTTASGRQRHRHHLQDEAAAALAGGALGAAAGAASRRRTSTQQPAEAVESPPVSIHVRTQDNGRKVTLRRLTEEEAAAQRAAKRQERRQRRRNSSFSSSSGGEALASGPAAGASNRQWRRAEALEAEQQAAIDAGRPLPVATPDYPTPPLPGTQHQHGLDPHNGQPYHVPPAPPIPASTSNLGPVGSITSPGTETSGATEYAENRRRRRAERAQARQAREARAGGGTGNTVDFT